MSDKERSYTLVMPDEYHRFDTDEVDAYSLADRSASYAIEDSVDADQKQASQICETVKPPILAHPCVNAS